MIPSGVFLFQGIDFLDVYKRQGNNHGILNNCSNNGNINTYSTEVTYDLEDITMDNLEQINSTLSLIHISWTAICWRISWIPDSLRNWSIWILKWRICCIRHMHWIRVITVSYTHLDVYKRQVLDYWDMERIGHYYQKDSMTICIEGTEQIVKPGEHTQAIEVVKQKINY